MAPKPEKSVSGSISCKHVTEGLHGKNIWSAPTFFGYGPIFFCSVNGASNSNPSLPTDEGTAVPKSLTFTNISAHDLFKTLKFTSTMALHSA